jgi:hypothetical protein
MHQMTITPTAGTETPASKPSNHALAITNMSIHLISLALFLVLVAGLL